MNNQKPNPFNVIPIRPDQCVKVWDFMVPSITNVSGHPNLVNLSEGRVRVLAVVPKKPHPLVNIPVAIAWCAPGDVKKFSKTKANKILIGRFMKAFEFCETLDYSDARLGGNVGIVVGPLSTLVDFGKEALFATFMPNWVNQSALWAEWTATNED